LVSAVNRLNECFNSNSVTLTYLQYLVSVIFHSLIKQVWSAMFCQDLPLRKWTL